MSDYDRQSELDDELLSAYLDDELSPEDRAAVESRLAADPAAQQLLHQLRAVCEAVQALPQEVVGHDMRDSILHQANAARQSATAAGPRAADEHADVSNGQPSTALDDAPKLTIGRTRRGWVWASLAIAAALLIMAFGREPERDRLPVVAQHQDKDRLGDTRGGATDLEVRAVNEPAASVAEFESAPPPDNRFAWQAPAADMDAVPAPETAAAPAPTSGPQPRGRAGGFGLATDSPTPPAQAQTTEELARNYGANSTLAEPMKTQDESLKEEIAEMPAADRLAAAAPTSELHDMKLGTTVADAAAGGEPAAAPAAPADENQAAGDPLVVVRVHAKRTALERRTFDQLLERNGIEVDSAPVAESGLATLDGSRRAARRFAETGQSNGTAEPASDQPDEAATVDAVLVEAPPAAITACIDGLNKDQENILGLWVDETAALEAKSASDSAPETDVFAKQNLAENLELTKYNRGVVPAEQESLARDKYHFYRSDGAGFGGGRFGGASSNEFRLELLRQGRWLRERKSLSESAGGLAVRLNERGVVAQQAQPSGQQSAQGGLGAENDSRAAQSDSQTAALSVGEPRREMKEAAQAGENKLQVLFLFSCDEAAAPSPPSRGKAQ
ncbi:MAG TPA: zf-HC2 domain-containing protein [Lacipirellulaceae bacterium]|nr:zf-HC2 domain-containing protein [Lacipirellulaceae bacterium]